MESYREKLLAREMEEIEKDNEFMHQQFREEHPDEAAADDAMVRNRHLPDAIDENADVVVPLPQKMMRCGNANCVASATAAVRKFWTGCRKKKCRLLFCNEVACAAMSTQHQAICMK